MHRNPRGDTPFGHAFVDPQNPRDPHCRAAGDLDGDGNLDIVAYHKSGFGSMCSSGIHRRQAIRYVRTRGRSWPGSPLSVDDCTSPVAAWK